MANPNRVSKPDIEKSEQELFNKSFDREFDVLAVEKLRYNATTNTLDRDTGDLKLSNTILFAPVSVSSSGDNQIVAAVASKKIKVLSCKLVAGGAVSVKWRNGTTDLEGGNSLVANSGYVLPASSPGQGHYLETDINTALNLNLSSAVQVSGHISYYTEA